MQWMAQPCLKQKKGRSGKLFNKQVPSGDYVTLSESWSDFHTLYTTTELLHPGCPDLRHALWPPHPMGQGTMRGIHYLCEGGSWVPGALGLCLGVFPMVITMAICYRQAVPRPHYRLVTNGGTQVVSDYQILPKRIGLESRSFASWDTGTDPYYSAKKN